MEFSQCDSSSHNRAEKVLEAGHLLEESWFFGNFLHHTKTKTMSRCYSDPCPSSTCLQQIKINESALTKTPSFPTNSMARGEFSLQKERFFKPSSRPKLARAPSLPSRTMIREEDQDEDDHESEFTMGRLIRQASLRSSDTLPPRQHSKVMTQSINIPRQHSRKKAEMQSKSMEEGCKDIPTSKNPFQNQEKIKGKSTSDIEFEQLKGFKDLGLTFEKEELNPRVRVENMIPAGLQEKSRIDQLGEGKLRRKHSKQKPYLSETWRAKIPSSPPRIPGSGSGRVDKSSAEDMKAQIKFWARAVASNVRQEC